MVPKLTAEKFLSIDMCFSSVKKKMEVPSVTQNTTQRLEAVVSSYCNHFSLALCFFTFFFTAALIDSNDSSSSNGEWFSSSNPVSKRSLSTSRQPLSWNGCFTSSSWITHKEKTRCNHLKSSILLHQTAICIRTEKSTLHEQTNTWHPKTLSLVPLSSFEIHAVIWCNRPKLT